MKIFLIKKSGTKPKYVKCSNCKVFDSINPIYKESKCAYCHQPLKEISEEEYKQKCESFKKLKEERKRKNINDNNINNNNNYRKSNNDINNNNISINNQDNNEQPKQRQRNNSSLHSSKIQFNNGNDGSINNNNINNINNENNNNQPHHHHNRYKIKVIKTGHHNLMVLGRDHSSERDPNIPHSNHNRNMIIIRPITNQVSHQNNNNNNININNQNVNQNQNQNQNRNIEIIRRDNRNSPFIVVQRHHVSNDIFDPNFNIFGSTFNHVFQDNFSSNFRSNFRGNFLNIILDTLSRNRAEIRRSRRNNPISEQNIQKLKRFNLTEKYCKKDNNDKLEKPTCAVCLEEIEIGKETILLPCGHMYHGDCCLNWLKTSNTCPICRFEIK